MQSPYAARLEEMSSRFADPDYGFRQFRQMAQEASGTTDQFLQQYAATGGSRQAARAARRARQQEAMQGAMDQFSQFRLGADNQALAALNASSQSELGFRQQKLAREKFEASKGGFGSMLGKIVGAGAGAFMGGAGSAVGGTVGEKIGGWLG